MTERDYKDEYKKFQSSKKMINKRVKLNKYNRDKGTYGNNDGKDASHKNGEITGFVDSNTNKGRKEKSRLKGSKRNKVKGYKDGGAVDDIPAMLTEGEYVIKKEAAEKLGYKKLDYMNETGEVPVPEFNAKDRVQNYALGGPVPYPGSSKFSEFVDDLETEDERKARESWEESLKNARRRGR